MQLNSLLHVALCGCPFGLIVYAWLQADTPSNASRRTEITRSDPLIRKNWKSTEVEVAGLYLGMPRGEASAAARRNGFQLMQYGAPLYRLLPCSYSPECFLAGQTGYDSDDVSIELGKRDEIIEIDLNVRPPEYGGRILRELTGQAHRFFQKYTDALRLELFGTETRREEVEGGYSPFAKDTRYVYADRGVTITVSPNPMTAPLPYLVTLSLIPPVGGK